LIQPLKSKTKEQPFSKEELKIIEEVRRECEAQSTSKAKQFLKM
jgi:serine O-acetyltransferase